MSRFENRFRAGSAAGAARLAPQAKFYAENPEIIFGSPFWTLYKENINCREHPEKKYDSY